MDLQRSGAKLLSDLLRAAPGARLASSYPPIAEALLSGASAQLRNVATVGGNLL